MTAWIRARLDTSCGSCRAAIDRGAVMLEVTIGQTRRARCVACGYRMGEGPLPDVPPLERVLPPLPVTRRPDFVTPASIAKAPRFSDFRRLQSGETD